MQTKALFYFVQFYWIDQNKCHNYGSFIDRNFTLKCKTIITCKIGDSDEYCDLSLVIFGQDR